ncbi:hypothetical protein ES288_A09G285000v1 [Gossypium darwinii]|uniref:Uncharacterized protein n=1 Tax=Gossypium darwinii TaxID=34276 RepID=A0A5D2FDR0_GOSDA|nr:hypothetical protein ES288_A09G285000v1 [Gossypium darwinii]
MLLDFEDTKENKFFKLFLSVIFAFAFFGIGKVQFSSTLCSKWIIF